MDERQREAVFWDRRFGRSFLKISAIITMIIDHVGCVLVPQEVYPDVYNLLRLIGRISFPLICYLLVEGFIHTSDWKRYAIRLGVFALVSEIPFDLAFYNTAFYWQHQNVMFTLLIALLVLKGMTVFMFQPLIKYSIMMLGCVIAFLLQTDYTFFGVLIVVVMHYTRNDRMKQSIFLMILLACQGAQETCGILAIPFLMVYDPDRVEKRLPKYFFYWFYPVHLMILYAVSFII